MSKSLKIILFAVGGFVGSSSSFAVATVSFCGRQCLQAPAGSGRLGSVGDGSQGRRPDGCRFFPRACPSRWRMCTFVTVGRTSSPQRRPGWGSICSPCSTRKSGFGKIALKHPSVSIERDSDGKFNFEKPGAGKKTLPALNLANSLSFRHDSPLRGQTIRERIRGRGLQAGACAACCFRAEKART